MVRRFCPRCKKTTNQSGGTFSSLCYNCGYSIDMDKTRRKYHRTSSKVRGF